LQSLVNHRTDIYSLGATLYELLTLEPAFPASDRQELLVQIVFQEPCPLRRLNKAVPLELETIVLKAMEKDPAERYATAGELADDLRRFLEDRPIQARRPGVVQRARKWARRHRTLVTATVVVMFITMLASLLGTVLVWREKGRVQQQKTRADEAAALAQKEQRRAEAERGRAEAATRRAKEARTAEANLRQRAEKTIEKAIKALSEDLAGRRVSGQRGGVLEGKLPDRQQLDKDLKFLKLCLAYDSSRQEIREAIAEGFRLAGDLLQWSGDCRSRMGDLPGGAVDKKKAEEAYGQAIAILEKLAQEYPTVPRYRYQLAQSCSSLGFLLVNSRQARKAETVLRQSLLLHEKLQDELSSAPADKVLAALRPLRQSPTEVEALRKSAALRQKKASEYLNQLRNYVATCHDDLGMMFAATGRPVNAVQAYRRALALKEKLVAASTDPVYRVALVHTCEQLARLFQSTRQPDEAVRSYLRAQAVLEKLVARDPKTPLYREGLARIGESLGMLWQGTGQGARAEAAFAQARKVREQLATDFPERADFQYVLAGRVMDHGKRLHAARQFQKAEAAYRQVQALLQKLAAKYPSVAEYRHRLAGSQFALGMALAATGRIPEAEKEYRQALSLWEKLAADFPKNPEFQSNLGSALASVAWLLGSQKEWAQARPLLERAIHHQQTALKRNPKHPTYRRLLRAHYLVLARTLKGLGEEEEAARAEESAAGLERDK
jgi:tetratricopeptide (TPR) repeat protein